MAVLRTFAVLLCLFAASSHALPTLLDLGANAVWSLDNHLGNNNVTLTNITVPSITLSVLEEAGLVTDPVYRYGELRTRWVSMDMWTWTARWNTTATSASTVETRTRLVLEGVDTIANVTLNDVFVGNVGNAHRDHVFDVEDLLLPVGENVLTITIHPTIPTVRVVAGAYPYRLPFSRYPGSLAQYNFVRKPATDFGWSFGPALMPHGVPGNVLLHSFSVATLISAGVAQDHHSNGTVDLTFDLVLVPSGNVSEVGTLSVAVAAPNGTVVGTARATVSPSVLTTASCAAVSYADTKAAAGATGACALGAPVTDPAAPRSVWLSLTVAAADVLLWHPYEFGESPIYTVTLAYQPTGYTAASATSLTKTFGFRTAQVRMDAILDETHAQVGETHRHLVNGVPLFVRGASVAPVRALDAQAPPGADVDLISAALDSNMNALRVWGGGRYGSEDFYSAADRSGLALLQDAMFTSAQYPVSDSFLSESRLELAYQAQRLSWHPSVISWAANSANEASMNWLAITGWNVVRFSNDQTTLSVDTLRSTLLAAIPNQAFLDTAPSNGVISTIPYVKRWGNTTNTSFGDILFYDYESDAFDPATYPRSRFVSEFGFQSWPSFNVYQTQVSAGDLGLRRPMSLHRTRIVNGLNYVAAQLGRHFTVANAVTGLSLNNTIDPEGLRAFAHVSQVQQSIAHTTALSKWRAGKLDGSRTAGAMLFQLNDVWAGLSWSTINYNGQYKLSQYAARDALAPTAAVASVDNASLSITLLNDLAVDVTGTLTVNAVPYAATAASDLVALTSLRTVLVPAHSGRADVWTATTRAIASAAALQRSIVEWTWCASAAYVAEPVPDRVGLNCTTGSIALAEFKDSTLGSPNVTVAAAAGAAGDTLADGPLLLTLQSTGGVALYVTPLPPVGLAGNFNATGFHLKPWEPVTVSFDLVGYARDAATVEELAISAAALASNVTVDWLQSTVPLLKRTV